MDKDKIFESVEKVNSGWNKFRTWATFIRLILLFFTGIAFVITGFVVNSELAVYIEKTTVVITDIATFDDSDQVTIYYEYDIDGKHYENKEIGVPDGEYSVGDSFECFYNKKNPSDIVKAGGLSFYLTQYLGKALIVIGVIILIISVVKFKNAAVIVFNDLVYGDNTPQDDD